MAVNNMAYTMTSCEDKEVRNPYTAKDFMARLFKKETSVITYLDTMAAVYAELGSFKKAVLYQEWAYSRIRKFWIPQIIK